MTEVKAVPISQQISKLMDILRGVQSDSTSPLYTQVSEWVRALPPASRPPELIREMQRAFRVSLLTLDQDLDIRREEKETPFAALVPPGWFTDYMTYTLQTEPPDVFHFFAAAVALGASMGRSVYFDMGAYQVYPNLVVLIIAPSGKCRKTSACNIAMSLLRKVGTSVLADKTTPEALAEAFRDQPQSVGTIYAPEFAVFLGKQKYQEGMIPMLTAWYDCPSSWKSGTITRGELELRNLGISFLGCSTMDWIQTAIPKDAFGGGFMSRHLFVIQSETPRKFPRPPTLNKDLEGKLVHYLREANKQRGEFKMTPEAGEWFDNWYMRRDDIGTEDKQFAGYNERKPTHIIRMAMLLSLGEGFSLQIEPRHLKRSLEIHEWLERYLPGGFGEMHQTAVGEDQARLILQLKKKGGKLLHSDWLRMNSNRMRRREFVELIDTLRTAKLVEYDSPTHTYFLTPEGWGYGA